MRTISLALLLIAGGTGEAAYSSAVMSCDLLRGVAPSDNRRVLLIDVRSNGEFVKEHISGAISVPFEHLSTWTPPPEGHLVLYCSGVGCPLSSKAANLLRGRGYDRVQTLDGGITAWKGRGCSVIRHGRKVNRPPTQSSLFQRISVGDLRKNLGQANLLVLDVRPLYEFKTGHVRGAKNLPLEEVVKRILELDAGKELVVYDRIPSRSEKAAKELFESGFQVSELIGGIPVWAAQGYPLEIGRASGQ